MTPNLWSELIHNVVKPEFREKWNQEILTTCFQHRTSKEDWFLLTLLVSLKRSGNQFGLEIIRIEEAMPASEKKIDLYFKDTNRNYYTELKHWLEPQRKTTNYKLSSWLAPKSGFWRSDIEKLIQIRKTDSQAVTSLIILHQSDIEQTPDIELALSNFRSHLGKEFNIDAHYSLFHISDNPNEGHRLLLISI